MLERYQLSTVSPATSTRAAVQVVDAISDERPATQVQTLSLLYLLMCEQLGVSVREELERASRIVRDGDGNHRPEVRALRAYVAGELT